MDVLQLMRERRSVRKYSYKGIEPEKQEELGAFCRACNEDSGLKIQLFFNEPQCYDTALCHYGRFSGVTNYICLVGEKSPSLEEKAGYYGEKIVLKAQELGLNTCWTALTHGKSKAVVGAGEKQVILIALGYGAESGTVHKNKPVEKLAGITEQSPEWYRRGVEAAMLAPTAVNQQSFYIEQIGEKAKIVSKGGICSKIDLGIVKYHFEAASGHETI